jgi:[ribosomal protein S18]-alanine N-acetyltransferase
MSSFTIRYANAADVPGIMAIASESDTAAHWPNAEYACIFEPASVPRIALVVESDGQMTGFIVARCLEDNWELENVAVQHASQHRGFGRALIEKLLSLARERSASRIFLEVRESNLGARNLYSQVGFHETGGRPAYYSHPIEDAITYEIVIKR